MALIPMTSSKEPSETVGSLEPYQSWPLRMNSSEALSTQQITKMGTLTTRKPQA